MKEYVVIREFWTDKKNAVGEPFFATEDGAKPLLGRNIKVKKTAKNKAAD